MLSSELNPLCLDPQALLLDEVSGKVTHTLTAHLDYSFAAAWHPNGLVFATGNQVRVQRTSQTDT